MQAFIVSIIAGIFFPMIPILSELLVKETHSVAFDTLTVTAVVYAAAIGLVSQYQWIVIFSLFCSTMCAVIYGVAIGGHKSTDIAFIIYGSMITWGTIYFFSICYMAERFGRHVYDDEPFLEL